MENLRPWFWSPIVPFVVGNDISMLEEVSRMRFVIKQLIDSINNIGEDLTTIHNTLNSHTNSITDILNRLITIDNTLSDLQEQITSNDNDITDLQNKVSKNTDDIANIKNTITNIENEIENIQNNITTLQDDVTILKSKTAKNESDIETINNDISVIQSNIVTIQSNIASLNANLNNLANRVTKNETDISSNTRSISNLKTRVENDEEQITTNTADITRLKSDVNDNDSDITNINNNLSQLDTKITMNSTNINNINRTIGTIETQLNTNTTDIGNLKTLVDNIPENVGTDINELTEKVNDNITNISKNTTGISNLNTAIESLELDIDNLQSEKLDVSSNPINYLKQNININGLPSTFNYIRLMKTPNNSVSVKADFMCNKRGYVRNIHSGNIMYTSYRNYNPTGFYYCITDTEENNDIEFYGNLENDEIVIYVKLSPPYNDFALSIISYTQFNPIILNEQVDSIPETATKFINLNSPLILKALITELETTTEANTTNINNINRTIGTIRPQVNTINDDLSTLENSVSDLTAQVNINTSDISTIKNKIIEDFDFTLQTSSYHDNIRFICKDGRFQIIVTINKLAIREFINVPKGLKCLSLDDYVALSKTQFNQLTTLFPNSTFLFPSFPLMPSYFIDETGSVINGQLVVELEPYREGASNSMKAVLKMEILFNNLASKTNISLSFGRAVTNFII